MGAFGIRERNERGDRLIAFAEEHKLIIATALFLKLKKKNKTKKKQKTQNKTKKHTKKQKQKQILDFGVT